MLPQLSLCWCYPSAWKPPCSDSWTKKGATSNGPIPLSSHSSDCWHWPSSALLWHSLTKRPLSQAIPKHLIMLWPSLQPLHLMPSKASHWLICVFKNVLSSSWWFMLGKSHLLSCLTSFISLHYLICISILSDFMTQTSQSMSDSHSISTSWEVSPARFFWWRRYVLPDHSSIVPSSFDSSPIVGHWCCSMWQDKLIKAPTN